MIGTRRVLLGARQFSPLDLSGLQLWLDASRSGSVLTGGAGQFVAANSEYLSIADNASLSTGDADFWLAGWIYADTIPTARAILGKWTANQFDFVLYKLGDGTISWRVGDGAATQIASVTRVGAISASTWYFFFVTHDAVNNTVNLYVNAEAPTSAATSGAAGNGSAPLILGGSFTATEVWDGRIANVAFGKSPPGGIAALATTLRDTLRNGGQGVDLRTIDAATKTAWGAVSAWPCNEISGTRSDVWGSNHLTDNNTVGAADGPYTYAAQDGDPVRSAEYLGATPGAVVQAAGTAKPIYKSAIVNGKHVLRFDGSNDALGIVLPAAFQTDDYTYVVVGARSVAAAEQTFLQAGDIAVAHQSFRTDGSQRLNPQSWSGGSADTFTGASALGAGFNVLTARRSTVDNALTGFVNGTLNGTDSALNSPTAAYGTSKILTLGSEGNGSSRILAGDIAEVLIYSRALSAIERSRIERYLGAKYGVVVF